MAKEGGKWWQRLAGWLTRPNPLQGARSPKWSAFRDRFLQANRECVACGTNEQLEAHHVIPFQLRKDLELSEKNLIALCRTCHLYFGHLKDWSSWNEAVRNDAAVYRSKIRARP